MKLYVIEPEDEQKVKAWETGTTDGLRRPIIGEAEAEHEIHTTLIAWVMEERE
jgi:hypothetical protein